MVMIGSVVIIHMRMVASRARRDDVKPPGQHEHPRRDDDSLDGPAQQAERKA